MNSFDLRDFKTWLEGRHRLLTIKKEVNIIHEMAAVFKKVNGETGLFIPAVKGYDIPVVSGMCGNRRDWADYFKIEHNRLREVLSRAIYNPIPWQVVSEGYCQEEVLPPSSNLLDWLPVPKFSELDSGHFITAGVVMVRESDTGLIHTSIRRMQVNMDGTLSILIESPGLWERYKLCEAQGNDLELAIVIGVHPLVLLASQTNSQLFAVDKLAIAGALAGEMLPVVKCKTIDLVVPADAEIVIEGRMLASARKTEGPFGELAGYYGPATEQPYVQIQCITHRRNPWFQVIAPGSTEHKLPNALMREVVLFDTVRRIVPGVTDVHLTMPGSGRFHAVIAINKLHEGEGKTAIMAALASNKDLKHVVVVDDDVNIYNAAEVEWAIASRFQAQQDLVVVNGARGCPLEPSHNLRGVSDKLGLDATAPVEQRAVFERIHIPGIDELNLDDYLE